jgi:hypothetical protein
MIFVLTQVANASASAWQLPIAMSPPAHMICEPARQSRTFRYSVRQAANSDVLAAHSEAQFAPPAAPGQTLSMRAQTRTHTSATVRPLPGAVSSPPVVGSLPDAVEPGSVLRPGSFVPAISLPGPPDGSLAEGRDGVADPPPPLPLLEQPQKTIAQASDAQAIPIRFMTTA